MKTNSEKVKELRRKISNLAYKKEREINETTFEFNIFKNNFCANYYASHFRDVLSFIYEQESMIGQEVYKFKNSFKYSTKEGNDLNPTFDEKEVLTEEKFEKCVVEYLTYQIEYLKNDIVRNPFQSGSNKMANLQREWEVETMQNLIRDIEELLYIMK